MRKVEFGSRTWRKRAIAVFISRIVLVQCANCGSPVASGYVCPWCNKDKGHIELDSIDYGVL